MTMHKVNFIIHVIVCSHKLPRSRIAMNISHRFFVSDNNYTLLPKQNLVPSAAYASTV